MTIRQIALSILALAIGTSLAAAATADTNKKRVTSWTCADFLAVDDQFKPKLVYAASAYAKDGKPLAGFIDIDGTEKVAPMIIADCTRSPQSSFMQKLKSDWSKIDADAKAEIKKLDKKL